MGLILVESVIAWPYDLQPFSCSCFSDLKQISWTVVTFMGINAMIKVSVDSIAGDSIFIPGAALPLVVLYQGYSVMLILITRRRLVFLGDFYKTITATPQVHMLPVKAKPQVCSLNAIKRDFLESRLHSFLCL